MVNQQDGCAIICFIGLVFVVLKLAGYVTWSWWLVLAWIWVPSLMLLGALLAVLVILQHYGKL